MIYLWLAFIAVAAIFNAAMDKVENENFYTSIFRNLNPNFWYKRQSWNKAKKIGGYKFDAWHLAKSLMLLMLFLPYGFLISWKFFGIAGLTWIVVFNLFYNRIFKK